MKVVIPMSGTGSRFVKAGYQDLKPLIKVQGKPIIEWVVSMFDKEDEFIFVCNKDHLQNTEMKSILEGLNLKSTIVEIEPHKVGPVYAVSKAYEYILDTDEDILVSYCDYFMNWDIQAFKKYIAENSIDGVIPCYTGFHPHLLPVNNLYASCRVDDNYKLLEIREKFSFEEDKAKAFHSPGAYYFRNGEILKKYFSKMMSDDNALNGEYYVSLVYKTMLEDNLNINVYPDVKHFCQWGTPYDLEEYLFWMKEIG